MVKFVISVVMIFVYTFFIGYFGAIFPFTTPTALWLPWIDDYYMLLTLSTDFRFFGNTYDKLYVSLYTYKNVMIDKKYR